MTRSFIPIVRFHLATLCLGGSLMLTAPLSAATHRHHVRHATPVLLREQRGSALEATARTLNSDLFADATQHHEAPPVILVGSATLTPHGKVKALFVQLQSARLCGAAGCTTSVYIKQGHDWVNVLDSINGNISLLPTRHNGFYDLLVTPNDRWIWNGEHYQDTLANP